MNKSEMVYDQKQLIANLIGCDCFGVSEETRISDYDDSISEISSMIEYFIDTGNEEETAEWRRMLQQTKVEKRRAKRMAGNKNRTEPAQT